MQTGKASFINGLSTDSTSQLSVNDQQKLVMYGNAVEYAKTNNIQLGQALTPEQIAGLSQPMLWYVEQTVPEPGCAATGNAKCPTVTALMPQVYLPENFTALSAGGQILASNDLSLNFGNTATGGSILNTGSITSGGTLTVNTGTLTNSANVVDVGEIWSYIKDAGYLKTTGTMVQPGGFMSAAAGGLTLNVDQFNQIGGALQLLDPNGQVDQAATQAFIAGVAAQLGDNFIQQTLQNDLHTDFVKQGGNFGIQQVGMIMASAMLAGALAPLMAGLVAAQLGSVAATFVAGGLGNVMASAALTAMASSTITQAMFTGSLDFGSVMKTGLSAAVTAGLLNGITYSSADGLGFSTTASPNSLASLAGVKPTFVDGAVSQAGATTAGQWFTQGVAILGQSVIQAGVQSTIQGGSFLEALKVSGVSNLSAALAYQIGNLGPESLGTLGYAGVHAALGCASSAALGTGCAGGAIGGALSALSANEIAKAVTNGRGITDPAQLAIISAATQLLSGLAAGAVGADPNAAALAAQNEVVNNSCALGHDCGTLGGAFGAAMEWAGPRASGVAQAMAGGLTAVAGTVMTVGGGVTCAPSAGLGCVAAAGGVALTGVGLDNLNAGLQTAITGTYTPTAGATLVGAILPVDAQTAEAIYGSSAAWLGMQAGSLARLGVSSGYGGTTGSSGKASDVLLLPAPSNSEPWMKGAPLFSYPSPKGGMYIQMAMAPGQSNPGGWGTLDSISSVNFVRNNLAVTPAFKPQIGSVRLFYVPEGVQVQVGTVGSQNFNGVFYPGGANQVQILNYADRAKLVPVGAPRVIK
ncbi:tRNA nuclease CdiA-2 [Pandoraea anapnoica]|uniref:tRNA nuclease CdiA-2 n=2 Tax=Pandoraea anapnoica TaxID=2508301 RepID=A0A5E5ASP2_9BURK|nr:tRNA nuclease CdiA-2 [Pandoraea anapnoica]